MNAVIDGSNFSNVLTTGTDEGEQTDIEPAEIAVPKDTIWENHFEDAEKMTTVTVIEDFDQVGLETVDPKPQPPPPTEVKKVCPYTLF